jgi:hypothetical protein
MALQRYVIVVATAFTGGWTMFWGLMQLNDWQRTAAARPSVWMVYPFDGSQGSWSIVVWLAISLAGVFIQLRYTGRMETVVRVKPKSK